MALFPHNTWVGEDLNPENWEFKVIRDADELFALVKSANTSYNDAEWEQDNLSWEFVWKPDGIHVNMHRIGHDYNHLKAELIRNRFTGLKAFETRSIIGELEKREYVIMEPPKFWVDAFGPTPSDHTRVFVQEF